MSCVTSIVFTCSLEDEENFQRFNERVKEKLEQPGFAVVEAPPPGKVLQGVVAVGAFNYIDEGRELATVVVESQWDEPWNISVLILREHDERFSLWCPWAALGLPSPEPPR